MKRLACTLLALTASFGLTLSQEAPKPPFTVRSIPLLPGPQITPYLQYQIAQAWKLDERRHKEFAAVRTDQDMRKLQARLRADLLMAIGGLPEERTPLNPKVSGIVRMQGYRIEKIVFESLPGFHVPALLYVPDAPAAPKPAVLVPCGHSQNGKIHYQYICSRLAKLGYVSLSWDPVGQGERSQFWDAEKKRSRYNLVCGEHAVLGNLAYLVGANLARWEIWDGMRALDYLLTRPEVDPKRIAITGTSGGGFQAAHIGALDERIQVVMPSCYITSLPMRMANRIFKDPDSDPEQDLFQMVSAGVDHPGLLALAYPRPVFVAAAVEDFFPIEGARRTVREIGALYRRLGKGECAGWVEGYHTHQYSPGNIHAAVNFTNRFFGLPQVDVLPAEDKLPDAELLCTRSGQVRIDYPQGKSLPDLIRERLKKQPPAAASLAAMYRGRGYAGVDRWKVTSYAGSTGNDEIAAEPKGNRRLEGFEIDAYLLHHSDALSVPLLHFHRRGPSNTRAVVWFTARGKAGENDWPAVRGLLERGFDVVSFDARALGENAMRFTATPVDDPAEQASGYEAGYFSPRSGVLANHVYNSLLNGRPYFLEMIEDAEIGAKFARERLGLRELSVTAPDEAFTLAAAVAEVVPGIRLLDTPGGTRLSLHEIVDQKREVWPVEYLLPNGAFVR